MELTQKSVYTQRERLFMIVILFSGVLARLLFLGDFPAGLHQDEAYAGYEALCLLRDGTDSWGYPFPVYLTAWGSGMNALQSFAMIPFIALFGPETWVIRLPQAILACVTLPAVYMLLSRLFSKRAGLAGLFVLFICPWHILMSRWGLEANFAPGYLTLAAMFLILSLENPRFYLLTGLFYGLSLYCYATIWPIVPLMLALTLVYLVWTRKIRPNPYLFSGVLILVLLALPLLLFLLVNNGFLPEICTPFFSIPKMPQMRGYDISLSHLYENAYSMFFLLLRQRDDMCWNSAGPFGLYTFLAVPLILIGFALCLRQSVRSLRERRWSGAPHLLIWLLCSVLQGLVINVNVVRLNSIHIPIVCLWALGLCWALQRIKRRFFRRALLAAFALSFAVMIGWYFTGYQETGVSDYYQKGLDRAVDFAQSVAEEDEEIHVVDRVLFPKILFLSQMPLDVYQEDLRQTAKGPFIRPSRVGRFVYDVDPSLPLRECGVCILEASVLPYYDLTGCQTQTFHKMAVVYPSP